MESSQFGTIRTAGTSENPLFCLSDICRALELQIGNTKKRLNERGVYSINTPTHNQFGAEVIQEMVYINEQNLYKVIMRSDKPQAEAFQDWVCGEVLPSKVSQRLTDDVLSKYPISDALGREQIANFVNEDGLYDVILDSRKPEAKAFRKWITSEILPSIRKTVGYISASVDETSEQIMAKALKIADETIKRMSEQIEGMNQPTR